MSGERRTPSYVGVDLGQASDFSALVVVRPLSADKAPVYAVPHLERFPLGTSYTAIAQAVRKRAEALRLGGAVDVVVDGTGVGRAVVDLLRPVAGLVAVTITSGRSVAEASDGTWHVPKKELVGTLQVVLQNRRLRVARRLAGVDLLVRELGDYQVRITPAAHETYAAAAGQHDDLVMALALALWRAEQRPHGTAADIGMGGGGLVFPKGVFGSNLPSPW